jgi:hypothetical protein
MEEEVSEGLPGEEEGGGGEMECEEGEEVDADAGKGKGGEEEEGGEEKEVTGDGREVGHRSMFYKIMGAKIILEER